MQQGNVGSVEKKDVEEDQCTNACGSCGSKECTEKDSRHPCEFLLRVQKTVKFIYIYSLSSEVLCKSGTKINIFCGNFLKFLSIESIMVLLSQEIPPFSLFLFPFWENFSVSFYTPTTMITGPMGILTIRACG